MAINRTLVLLSIVATLTTFASASIINPSLPSLLTRQDDEPSCLNDDSMAYYHIWYCHRQWVNFSRLLRDFVGLPMRFH